VLAGAQERAAAPVEELRSTVESQLGKLKEQVALGMAGMLRQIDAIRPPEPGPHGPSRLDRRRPEPGPSGPPEPSA
jgi:hypothetical protein